MKWMMALAILLVLAVQPAQAQTPSPQATPAAPTAIRAGLVTPTTIEVVWVDNALDDVRSWLLWRQYAPGQTYQSVIVPTPDVESITLTGLLPDTEYVMQLTVCSGPRAPSCAVWSQPLLVRTLSLPTPTPTLAPTSTPSPTSTETPTPTPSATSTPTPTSTPSLCPGTFVAVTVEHNTLTVTCVKTTETPWPDSLLIPSWRIEP